MISGPSTPTLNGGTTFTAKIDTSARSGDNLSLDTPSFPPASSDRLGSINLPASTALDPNVVHDVTFDENDIVIAVMGATGTGKSSFVNTAAGRAEVVVGHGFISQTRTVKPVRCPHPDGRRNIVLVDTPGFRNTYLTDAHVLEMIANWLKDTYQKNIKLAGIIYLHNISDVRMSGTPLRNLAVFKDLCGEGNLKNIILVTTMWDLEDKSVGSMREEELRSKYWKDMIHLGSQTGRYLGTHASAWQIIEQLNPEGPRQPFQIQLEMVDLHMQLQETAAGKTMFRTLRAELNTVWRRVRSAFRKTRPGPRIMSPELYLRGVGSTSSLGSGSSETRWHMLSTSTSSNSSCHTSGPFSPAESTPSGCSPCVHRDTLFAVIQGLTLAHQMADIATIPTLRGAIWTVLQLAQTIRDTGGVNHMISEVVECSGCLLEEIAQCTGSTLSKDMRRTLSSFRKELRNLQIVVNNISTRDTAPRFSLQDADIQAITACTTAIKAIRDLLEVTIAVDNFEAIARLEAQITRLCNTSDPFSPAESTPSRCSLCDRRDEIFAMIQALTLAYQMADIAAIPTLQRAIGTVLQLAKLILEMGGAHHMISEVVECSVHLLFQCRGLRLSKNMKKTLSSFQKKLSNLQNVVKEISTRNITSRFYLYNADIQAIIACAIAIRAIHDQLQATVAIDNLEAIARLEAQITKLCDAQAPLRCECGLIV